MRTPSTSAGSWTAQFTFSEIDQQIALLRSPNNAALLAPGANPTARLVAIYSAVRPILQVILSLPLIQPAWRAVIRMFVDNLDALAAAFDATFKAGKDL